MIFVPLLHYFKCKNQYSGSEDGMRYLLSPGKRSVPDPDGGEGAQKEEAILTVDIWPAFDVNPFALRSFPCFITSCSKLTGDKDLSLIHI